MKASILLYAVALGFLLGLFSIGLFCKDESGKIQELETKVQSLQIQNQVLAGYKDIVEKYYDKEHDTIVHKHCLKNFY